MLEAAQTTTSRSSAASPARPKATRAAASPISAMSDGSSSERAGRFGRIRAGSSIPSFSTTCRRSMPEAETMNSAETGALAWAVPAAISSACSAFQRAAWAL
jgi:hypothetical protein